MYDPFELQTKLQVIVTRRKVTPFTRQFPTGNEGTFM